MTTDRNHLPEHEFSLEEAVAALLMLRGIRIGLWRLAVRFRTRAVAARWPLDNGHETSLPSAVASLDHFSLFRVTERGPLVFDAIDLLARYAPPQSAAVSPAPKRLRKKAAPQSPGIDAT